VISLHRARWVRTLVASVFLTVAALAVHAESGLKVLSVDLPALIEKASRSQSQFAVDVPYNASPSTAGEWTTSSTRTTWNHSAQIPGAVSMSFHASRVSLPASATLTVTANGVRYVYTSANIHGGEMWSRIARGDTLSFELDVATADAGRVQFEITSLQAGYRGLGADAPNHPRYNQLHIQAATSATESCSENWDCRKTPANAGAGQATVALVIANLRQCSGTLLNDVPGDGTPYVLTARHCQNGDANGGGPSFAGSTTIYWDAISACGMALGRIYDSGVVTQFGATTVVDQQDAWLIRLNDMPAVDDAYYAGWDATGAAFVGGFTPHHALGSKRQFVGWYGQASYNVVPASRWNLGFDSTIWATVNGVGNGGPGSSGSGLFDDKARLVGVLVRGKNQGDDESSPGVCPVSSPAVPTLQSSTGFSTALAGIFSSTSDPKSSTGSVTMQSVLDPSNTGTKVVDGRVGPMRVTLLSRGSSQQTGSQVRLEWLAPNAVGCTASGGELDDGWAGSLANSGTKDVTGYNGGNITYVITCTDGTRSNTAQTTVHWDLSPPTVSLYTSGVIQLGVPFQLTWTSNLRDCVASGGKSGDGWSAGALPSSGVRDITEVTPGLVTFQITCGKAGRTATAQAPVAVNTPFVNMMADATSLRIGQPVTIRTSSQGGPCLRTGGGTGDGWAGSELIAYDGTILTETVPGTYTYVTRCGSGSYVATAQVTVSFTNDAPLATIYSSKASAITQNDGITLTWSSNVRPCSLAIEGQATNEFFSQPRGPTGTLGDTRNVIGRYTYTVVCGSGANTAQGSTVVDWTGTPQIRFSVPTAAVLAQGFTFYYSTNVLPCIASGGGSGDGWAGRTTKEFESFYVREAAAGSYTFSLSCDDGTRHVQSQTTVKVLPEGPTVSLTATRPLQLIGKPVTLTWTSNTSQCTPSGGNLSNDGWTGPLAGSGSITITEPIPTGHVYILTCSTEGLTTTAVVTVHWQLHVPPTFTASTTEANVGNDVTLQWESADGTECMATGGVSGDNWAGSKPASGSAIVRSTSTGSYPYAIACGGSDAASVSVNYTVPVANVTLAVSSNSVDVGSDVTLTWTTQNVDSCTASGGAATDGWDGTLSAAGGSKTVRHTSAGGYSYSINCTGSGGLARTSASTYITVKAAATAPASGSSGSSGGGSTGGGGGGGGAMSVLDVGGLGAVLLIVLRARRRGVRAPVDSASVAIGPRA